MKTKSTMDVASETRSLGNHPALPEPFFAELDFIHLKVRLRAKLPVKIGFLQLRYRVFECLQQS
jgi:hypothetical protein